MGSVSENHSTGCSIWEDIVVSLPVLHAVATVGPHIIIAVDTTRDHSNVKMVLGTSGAMRTGAEAGHGHLIHISVRGRLLDREQSAGLLALTLEFLQWRIMSEKIAIDKGLVSLTCWNVVGSQQ